MSDTPQTERWATVATSDDKQRRFRVGIVDGKCVMELGPVQEGYKVICDRASMAQKLADICHFYKIRAVVEGVSGAPIEPLDLENP